MNRVHVIQELIDRKKAETYLEIGFGYGDAFLNIKAPRKIVVDPKFVILKKRVLKYFAKNISKNIPNRYHRMTSDYFFERKQHILRRFPPDVIFVDGLHTHEQSLKDVFNALKFLNKNGIIVLHDCNPLSEAVAYPARSYREAKDACPSGWNGFWSGDVWKTAVYVRSKMTDLEMFVLDFDTGLGIITRKKENNPLEFSEEKIERLSYADLEKDRARLLNVKDEEYFREFVKTL
ncbi:MAG: class I SAM-dependent methyltransferase [Candidatus Omnitrophica bacterium]|nr:class I SAM-dependent methyltransferase [Candidatus Omnitrophota bacterium]